MPKVEIEFYIIIMLFPYFLYIAKIPAPFLNSNFFICLCTFAYVLNNYYMYTRIFKN